MLKFIRTQSAAAASEPQSKEQKKQWKMEEDNDYKLKLKFDSSCQLEIVRLNGSHFKNLSHLNLCENNIQKLDLLALDNLEWLQCSRNQLVELTFNGKNLRFLAADHNRLKSVTAEPSPTQLETLELSNNDLSSVPERILRSSASCLQTLRIGHNQLSGMPPIALTKLKELILPCNQIQRLPQELFNATVSLRVLNVSKNQLSSLPHLTAASSSLQELFLSANRLEGRGLHVASTCQRLKVLHASHNRLTGIEDSWLEVWKDLEELVLSGNQLESLPPQLSSMKKLRVLRLHSSKLDSAPTFSSAPALKILDLSHNHLTILNMEKLIGSHLQVLDLSCNSPVPIDPRQLQQIWGQCRPISLVSVPAPKRPLPNGVKSSSGSNNNRRVSSSPPPPPPAAALQWAMGFSETPDSEDCRLCISQLRLLGNSRREVLFGMVDGGSDSSVSKILAKVIPRVLQEEQFVVASKEYMKYTILAACRHLREQGHSSEVVPSAFLGHICTSSGAGERKGRGSTSLRATFMGAVQAVLSRGGKVKHVMGKLDEPFGTNNDADVEEGGKKQGQGKKTDIVLPDPQLLEVTLEEGDEILVASKSLWEHLSAEEAVLEGRRMSDPTLAAKRLQDMAQGYGCRQNVSVLVVRGHMGPHSDHHHHRHHHHHHQQPPQDSCSCSGGARRRQEAEDEAGSTSTSASSTTHFSGFSTTKTSTTGAATGAEEARTDRSSPSGQSGDGASEAPHQQGSAKIFKRNHRYRKSEKAAAYQQQQRVPPGEDGCQHHQQSSQLHQVNGSSDFPSVSEQSSLAQVNEEQFKCWEYILEENTHKLFRKELDTLSRSGAFQRSRKSRLGQSAAATVASTSSRPNSTTTSVKTMASDDDEDDIDDEDDDDGTTTPSSSSRLGPFLSRYFGSARSFLSSGGRRSIQQDKAGPPASSSRQPLGGPNAAYFGSLQRLMPQGLEYNFEKTRECKAQHDSLEYESRLHKYWDNRVREVKTTEL